MGFGIGSYSNLELFIELIPKLIRSLKMSKVSELFSMIRNLIDYSEYGIHRSNFEF